MKIDLTYDGKNYYDPLFTFMWNNEKDNFGIGIKHSDIIDYNFIVDDINNNFENFKIKGNSFCYYTKENVYVFDLSDSFYLIPKEKDFKHCIVLLDNNNKIIKKTYRQFTSELL